MMPRTILVPVDFGEASGRAVSIAGSLARHCEAAVTLLHAEAVEAPVYFTPEQITALEAERRLTRVQAERYLTEFGHAHTAEPFVAVVEDGPAAEAILIRAREAELVVMGTHGRRGPKRWWLGSVAERVLREIERPLMIVRADAPTSADAAFHRAIVHAMAPLQGANALAYAQRIAGCFGGEASDARFRPVEPALTSAAASILVTALAAPPAPQWLASYGESLVRNCRVPILFVPDFEGALA